MPYLWLLPVLLVFYCAYFTKQLLLKQKGIRTNRLAKGNKPRRTLIIETALLCATYGIAFLQCISLFIGRFLLLLPLPVPLRAAGLCLAIAGAVFFLAALWTMRDSWRAGVDRSQTTTIVTRGIYRYSRNPAFVGFDLFYLGSALYLANAALLLAACAGIALLHLQIREEEAFLPHVFGQAYLDYKTRTPRYLLFF